MGLDVPRLVRPPRPGRQGLERPALDGVGGGAPGRGRCADEGRGPARERAPDRLGVRSHLLRRRAHDGRARRPREQHPPHRHRPCQRPPDERQQRHAAAGRNHPRQRGRGRGQVRRRRGGRRTHRRAAGAGRDVPGAAQDRQRGPPGPDDRRRRALLRPPGLHAGRDHRHRPGQQAHRARLPRARDRDRR